MFEPAEWLAGRMAMEAFDVQGAYINLCAVYWQKMGDIQTEDARLRLGDELYDRLVKRKYIGEDEDHITIGWLDVQIEKLQAMRKIRSELGKKGALAKQKLSNSQANGQQKRREEKRREETIPSVGEFIEYAKEKKPEVNVEHVRLKYEAWKSNDWSIPLENGKDRPIKNWKTTLLNTIPYLKEPTKDTFKGIPGKKYH